MTTLDAKTEGAQMAWEKATHDWHIRQYGERWVVSFTPDRVEDYIDARAADTQVVHHFSSEAEAKLFKREKIIVAILSALPTQPVEVTEEMVNAAEAAVYPHHERGFLSKPLIDAIDMRKAIEAALSHPSGDGIRAGRAEVIEECVKAITIASQQPIHSGEMRYVAGHRLGVDRSLAAIRALIAPQEAVKE